MLHLRLDVQEHPGRIRYSAICSCGSILEAETEGGLKLAVQTHLDEEIEYQRERAEA